MKKSLKNELAILTGLGAISCLLGRRYRSAAVFGGFAAGLLLTTGTKPFLWEGKSVVITGGSRGLGLGLARALLSKKAKVTLLARKTEELARARDSLINTHPDAKICTIVCDITKKNQLADAIKEASDTFGVIDALINNAGAISVGPLESMTRIDFEAQMNLHLYSVIEATELITPHFRQRGGGRIINICSLGGRSAVPHMLPYNASKFALAGFSQGAAIELDKDGIVVTTVYPALMQTGSPIQAVFKGEHEKEFAWFDSADNFPGLSMSPVTAAQKILNASSEGKTELVLSVVGKARVLAGVLFPEVVHSLMTLLSRLMPIGNSELRRTGHQSRAYFDSSIFTGPLRKRARSAEIRYNQFPSEDADFNLGLKS